MSSVHLCFVLHYALYVMAIVEDRTCEGLGVDASARQYLYGLTVQYQLWRTSVWSLAGTIIIENESSIF